MAISRNMLLKSIVLYAEERRISESPEKELVIKETMGKRVQHIDDLAVEVDRPSIVVMLNGSFSPLTVGHVDLAERGLAKAREKYGVGINDRLFFLMGTSHAHKNVNIRNTMAISDRLHSLESFAMAHGNISLAITNQSRYINTLPLVQAAYPNSKVCALIGADVLELIVDPKFYNNSESETKAALKKVFQFDFLVSQREYEFRATKKTELVTVEKLIEHYPLLTDFESNIQEVILKNRPLREDLTIAQVSATRVRNLVRDNKPYEDLVAEGLSEFVEETGAYLARNIYAAYVSAVRLFTERFYDPETKQINFLGELHHFLKVIGVTDPKNNSEELQSLREQTILAYESFEDALKKPEKDERKVLDDIFKTDLFKGY